MQEEAVQYGIDPHGHFPDAQESNVQVTVPETVIPQLPADQLHFFYQHVLFSTDVDVFDCTSYIRGLQVLNDIMQ